MRKLLLTNDLQWGGGIEIACEQQEKPRFQPENSDLPRVTRKVDLTARDSLALFKTIKDHVLRVLIVYSD